MTPVSKIVGLLLSLFLLLLVQPVYAEERSFEIGEVDIHARIDTDGNMHVTEQDTYHFKGAFNGIIIDLNTSGSDGIEHFQAFEVSDQQKIPLNLEESSDGDKLQYKIYSQSENETKVFHFTYSFKNIVQVYADTAELYWKFFDHTNPSTLGTVRINVEFPDGAEKEEIVAFGHGPLTGAIERTDTGTVRYQVSPLPSGELLEVRILFPGSYVPGSTKISSDFMRDQIVEEERNWMAETDHAADDDSVYAALALLIANLVAGILIYVKYGRAFKPDWQGKYYRELPGDVTPAVVSYLMNYRIEPRDLMATMVDLVRKKHVAMQAVKKPDKKNEDDYTFQLINAKKDGLLPHEKILINWFFGELGRGGKVSLSDIRRHADNKNRAEAFVKQWLKWQDQVLHSVNRLNYIEESEKRLSYSWVILAVAVQFFGIWFLVPEDWNWIMFCSLPLLFFKPKSRRRTQIGQTEYTKWKAFKRFLRDYSQIASREPLAIHLWEHYFVYAIPLGEARRMDAISRINMPGANHDTLFYDSSFFIYYDWTSSFEKTISEGSKTSSSSGDSGDSFSSGGGDGGGGGGRGAF
jgi:uncharacterized membrane protein